MVGRRDLSLKRRIFELYGRRTTRTWRLRDAGHILTEAALRAGCDLRREPRLEEAKRLLARTVQLMRTVTGAGFHADAGTDEAPWSASEFDRFAVPIAAPVAVPMERQPADPAGRAAASRPMEILLVEDSLTFAQVTMGALQHGRIPHHMNWLQDGADALEFLRQHGRFADVLRPDLVLLDLGLPGLDGREILAAIRTDADLRDLPVVVMTASQSIDDRLDCELLEVEGYLTKPVDLRKFLRLVRQLKEFWREDMLLPTGA